jgi:cytochrome P450
MQQLMTPVTPPVPIPPERPLPAWRVFRLMRRNIIATWPRAAYEEMVVRRRLFGADTLIVNDPDLVRHVLTGNPANYERPLSIRRALRPALRNGVLLSDGTDWRRQRRMLAPLFTPQHVSRLLPHFAAAGAGLLGSATGARVNLADLLQRAALDAVCRALFSMPAESAGAAGLPDLVREFLGGVGRITIWDLLARNEGDFASMLLERVEFAARWTAGIDAVIRARDALPAATARRDVLNLLRDARDPEGGGALEEDEIREQVATLLAAGFETTARAMFWTAYLLSYAPEAQGEIRAELAAFPPGAVGSLADLDRWPALRRALLEALRLYPTAPFLGRVARGPDRLGEIAIDRGAFVMVCPWIIHRHRRFWDAPDAFLPSRWAGRGEQPGAHYLPFGAGPRICLGAIFAQTEAMVLLGTLLSRYEIVLDDTRPVLPQAVITTVPSVEPWFRLRQSAEASPVTPARSALP